MKVKVILQEDVTGLGEEGDVKDVAGGYARNYLLPRAMVVPATKGNLRVLEQQRARIEEKLEQRRAEARAVAEHLSGVTLDFTVRVGEQGRLYGSITAQEIAERLHADGIEIDRRTIELKEPLRALGRYDVTVRVAHAVTAHINVALRDQNGSLGVEEKSPVVEQTTRPPQSEEEHVEDEGEEASGGD